MYTYTHIYIIQDFHAQTAESKGSNELNNQRYLRSGDLGFLHDGELFICGRSKDLIIIRGSNHYPQDIERTAERSQPLLRAGCSAAFSVSHTGGHTEMVVYVAEVIEKVQNDSDILAKIVTSCRQAVSTEHGLTLSSVVLLKTRSVPKTTSGKIARIWCKRGFIDGTLSVLHRWDGVSSEKRGAGEEGKGAEEGDEGGGGKMYMHIFSRYCANVFMYVHKYI